MWHPSSTLPPAFWTRVLCLVLLQVNAGVDIDGGPPKDLATAEGIMDVFAAKWWAIKLATDAVVTVLKVDQIIMAKQAGGPRPRGPGDDDD